MQINRRPAPALRNVALDPLLLVSVFVDDAPAFGIQIIELP
jgi:hypothetical protein